MTYTSTTLPRSGDLSVFTDPSSVAVVGASASPEKWGYWLAKGALAGQRRREVHLVNARRDEIMGHPCTRSLADLDVAPELVALCVPGPLVADVVDEALALGTRGFLAITAAVPGEQDLAQRIRDRGARLVGANSLGIYDASSELDLTWGDFASGSLAIVSQSGQVGSELARLAAAQGLGISRFISVGNQTDVGAAELLADLTEHRETSVVAVYLESFTHAQLVFNALDALHQAGKRTILLTVGSSAAGSRLARSHTGSMTAPIDVVDAVCRARGVLRAHTPSEVIDAARCFLAGAPTATGRRVAIVGDSGGQCGIAADRAEHHGLGVGELTDSTQAALSRLLPVGAATANPVDLAGAGEAGLASYADAVELALGDPTVHAAVLTGYFGCYGQDNPELQDTERATAERLAAMAHQTGKPLFVHSMADTSLTSQAMWGTGVPVFAAIDPLLRALTHNVRKPAPHTARLPTPMPAESAEALADGVDLGGGYWSARQALSRFGVRFPRGEMVTTLSQARATAQAMTTPLVLKAAWLEHKSEHRGVVVGLESVDAVAEAFADMRNRLGPGTFVLEEMDTRPDGVEMLIGCSRHSDLGVTITVGTGGTAAEVYADVAIEAAPVDLATAHAMISDLHAVKLLRGWRGRPATNVAALAQLVSLVSAFVVAVPAIAELELNPVRVTPEGVMALDALVLTVSPAAPTSLRTN